ncbi:apolipoprotein N-acyltransferase [Kitasatospora sp. NPDC058397]|uniref:apolipoprotein N-acyltransferase n=1 Tax=unclassified Kitasatospora TaxID=2633591 RepID=UPI00364B1074
MPRRLALTSPARRTPHREHSEHREHPEHSPHPGHPEHSSHPGHPRHPEPPGHSEHGGQSGHGGHPQARPHRYRARFGALAAGAVPVLAFPAPGQAWLAWVALVPGMLLMQRAPGGREAAVRGWWFGAGFILTAMYWLVPSIGPGLPVLAVLFGALQGGFGYAVHRLLHPPLTGRRALLALVVVPAVWVTTEYARSWDALGGPWALLGATQWQHPAILGLASTGGIWLVSAAVAAANTGVLIVLTSVHRRPRALAALTTVLVLAAGPLLFALRDAPAPAGAVTVALVQPGIVDDPQARFEASAQATAALGGQPVDLVVWGESSTTADLDRDPAALDRLRQLSTATGAQIIAGEDARKADGRISKDAVLVSPAGVLDRYRKIRLVPFGEYIPLRPVLGWIAGVSRAAGENRAPGTAFHVLPATDRAGGPLPVGALICFESAFPDLARTAARDGARVLVYQSSTSTFQHTWAPEQHVSLAAIRAAETGRPAVQASLTGVSAAFDAQGRELARLGTDGTGALTVRLPLTEPGALTWYDRIGDVVPIGALLVTAGATAAAWRSSRSRRPV